MEYTRGKSFIWLCIGFVAFANALGLSFIGLAWLAKYLGLPL